MFYKHSNPSCSKSIPIFHQVCLFIAPLPSRYEIYLRFIAFITSLPFYLSAIQVLQHTPLFIHLDTTLAMLRKHEFLLVASSHIWFTQEKFLFLVLVADKKEFTKLKAVLLAFSSFRLPLSTQNTNFQHNPQEYFLIAIYWDTSCFSF